MATKDGMRAAAIFLALLVPPGAAWAEMFESKDKATHVVIGTVKTVDVRWSLGFDALGSYFVRHYRAAIEVESAVTGQGVQPGQTIYVRYWRRDWVPLTLVAILGLALLGHIGLKSAVHVRSVRLTLAGVLFAVALFAALLALPLLPGMGGHGHFPQEGDRVRAYLKAHPSGEYDALYPQWVGGIE